MAEQSDELKKLRSRQHGIDVDAICLHRRDRFSGESASLVRIGTHGTNITAASKVTADIIDTNTSDIIDMVYSL